MKPMRSVLMAMLPVVLLAATNRSPVTRDSTVMDVFAATTPCGNIIRPLHQISMEADCALVQWSLTLYEDPVTHKPTTYKIVGVNRFIEKPSNQYSQPGTRSERSGKWSIVKGTKADPKAVVYQLDTGDPKTSLRFIKLCDDLLHLLDQQDELMIGNAFWSYTLNKVKN